MRTIIVLLLASLLLLAACVALEMAPAPTPNDTTTPPLAPYPPPEPTRMPGPLPTKWYEDRPTEAPPPPPPTNPPGPTAEQTVAAAALLGPSPTRTEAGAIDFLDERTGWMTLVEWSLDPENTPTTGLLFTEDGGSTWMQRTKPANWLGQLDFVSPLQGWASSGNGTWGTTPEQWFATQDSGLTWTPVIVSGFAGTSRMDFVDGNNGWALGWIASTTGNPLTVVLTATTDGGQTWEPRHVPEDPRTRPWSFISFIDDQTGWFLAYDMGGTQCQGSRSWLWKTEDGARSWQLITGSEPWNGRYGRYSQTPYPAATLAPYGGPPQGCILGFEFFDNRHGWLTSLHAGLYATEDGGVSWRSITPAAAGIDRAPGSLSIVGPGKGYVGFQNLGLLYIDGNGTAVEARFPPRRPLALTLDPVSISTSLRFADGQIGLAIGDQVDPTSVFRTNDAGRTWQLVGALPDTPPGMSSAGSALRDGTHGWAFAAAYYTVYLYTTDDGGVTWRCAALLSQVQGLVNAVMPVDESTTYVGTNAGQLLVTGNGGSTFTQVAEGTGASTIYDFVSASYGWKATGEGLFTSHDGGRSWTPVPLGYHAGYTPAPWDARPAFDLTPDGRAWVIATDCPASGCGQLLLSTDDDGATWTRYDLGAVHPVHIVAADAQHAWLLDSTGRWLATADGGASWEQVYPAR